MCGCYNLDGFIRITHALSLNDTFWIKPVSSQLQWENVSLYQNQFDETIAKIAFEGGLYGKEFTTTSPEFGTSGSFAKYHDKLASKRKLFTSEREGYVPITKFFDKIVSVKDILEKFQEYYCEEDFRRMIVLDALILNTDRHMGNYGFIVNNETMQVKRMAPMFDHNQSLLPYAEKEDFKNLDIYLASRPTQIGEDFNEVAHALLTPDIQSDLRNLKGFEFEQNGEYNLPEQRLKELNRLIDRQIDGILESKRLYIPSNEYTNNLYESEQYNNDISLESDEIDEDLEI